ncbi:serine hydrolase domain-containing protein [Rhodohalobacter halophilus]|uniref:serine hydrolase domain-containing protein n=1 Tax=Rhodohalobacter halophilus TaxID=1812810 RepID=UPI00083FAD7A|nr:serine hydrolase domain-containing protein [Rhodohalobacter halophilus]
MNSIKYTLLLSILVLLAVSCSSVSEPDKAVHQLEVTAELSEAEVDSIASALSLFPNGTQFSIAFISDSIVSFYGAHRINDVLESIDNHDRVFEIGSISKVFTSTLLAHAIHDSAISADQTVRDVLDVEMAGNPDFTFLQLSNHTSGLPRLPGGYTFNFLWNMDNPYKIFDEVELKSYLKNDLTLSRDPGEAHRYSNLGAGLLGFFLSELENISYEDLLQRKIFEPMGMNRSTTDRENVEEYLVSGVTKRGGSATNWDLADLAGAGGILSTAEDLSRFIRSNFNPDDPVLSLQREPTFQVSDNMDVAMGWFILNRDSGAKWYWHNGGTGGYRSSIVMDPDQKIGVVVLSNISAGHSKADNIDRLSFDLMETYFAN